MNLRRSEGETGIGGVGTGKMGSRNVINTPPMPELLKNAMKMPLKSPLPIMLHC